MPEAPPGASEPRPVRPGPVPAGPCRRAARFSSGDAPFLLLAAGITLAAYLDALPNGFIVNWDDHLYVTQNESIRDFSWGGVVRLFTTCHFENYHPLTNLSNMIEYRLL